MKTKLEVCIDNEDGINACIAGKAGRIELCSALDVGGLTPSIELMNLAANCPIPTRVMIRPKSGDFYFSSLDMRKMIADISSARSLGLEGVVLGVTTKNAELDKEALKILSECAVGMGRTLHRAVDSTLNPIDSVEIAIELGFDCILSSGGSNTATQGIRILKEMHNRAAGRIDIMPGSGINSDNVDQVSKSFKPNWFHSSCSSQSQNIVKLNQLELEEGVKEFTDLKKIINLRNAIN